MELEDLKKGWREIDEHIDRMDENNEMAQRVVREHIVSVRERLKNRFRRMTLLCLMAPGVINLLFLEIDGIGSWTKFAFLFFFTLRAAVPASAAAFVRLLHPAAARSRSVSTSSILFPSQLSLP